MAPDGFCIYGRLSSFTAASGSRSSPAASVGSAMDSVARAQDLNPFGGQQAARRESGPFSDTTTFFRTATRRQLTQHAGCFLVMIRTADCNCHDWAMLPRSLLNGPQLCIA